MSWPRLLAEFARFYGWTHDEIMSLTARQFLAYSCEILHIRKAENLMSLAIATNPHIEAKHQKELWVALRDRSMLKPASKISEKHRADYERIQKLLAERRAKDGKVN